MLETLIKRSGEEEAFSNEKGNGWMIWAGDDLLDRLDWSSVIMEARSSSPTKMTTQEWQAALIEKLKVRGAQPDGWPYMQMAGRLYTVYLMKKIHGDSYPTLAEHLELMHTTNLCRNLNYTPAEINFIEEHIINHKANLEMSFTQVEQYQQKYALRNRTTKRVYETPQFTMIRMAMAVYENDLPNVRLGKVRDLYLALNEDLINPPTPNYAAMGTSHYGMASCCLIAAGDDAMSIKVADIIAYSMTLASAGIGLHLSTRAPGDPVDGGRVDHAGRLNYARMYVASCAANKQGMRGGALNIYDTLYSPEAETSLRLQNPRTPVELRERRVNITYQTNRHYHLAAATRQKCFEFSEWSAPDLYKAFFDADQDEFERLYAKYEADPNFKKKYFDAFDRLVMALEQEGEVSTLFWNDPNEMNSHTPFLDRIIQSNLCTAPETKILTDKGFITIGENVGKKVNVWNGEEFSETEIVKTADNAKLLTVRTSLGFHGRFTEMHKWYVDVDGKEVEVRTKDLKPGMKLVEWKKPTILRSMPYFDKSYHSREAAENDAFKFQLSGFNVGIGARGGNLYIFDANGYSEEILRVDDNGEYSDTFCFTEPKKHRGVFNGMYTGQCMEVMVPTERWKEIIDLYGDGDPSKGETGICNIGSVPQHNFPFDPQNPLLGYEEYKKAVRAQLEMIDFAIDNSEYHFPAIAIQAKSRRNASVGMSGVATLFAQMNLKFNSAEGRTAWHRLNERHAFACTEVALEMGIEKGNAPWMHRTKWPQGWLFIDTYKKEIDKVVDNTLFYNWEDLRSRIIANGGIRFSCLIAHMPGEQATRKGKGSNSLYPLFNLSVDLSDGSSAIPWAALDNDLIGEQYQMAWDMDPIDMAIHYGICQKFTDQGISADVYIDRVKYPNPTAVQLVDWFLARVRYGNKSKYYTRSRTFQQGAQAEIVEKTVEGVTMLLPVPKTSVSVDAPVTMSALDKIAAQIAAAQAAAEDDGLGAEAFMGCGLDGACTN